MISIFTLAGNAHENTSTNEQDILEHSIKDIHLIIKPYAMFPMCHDNECAMISAIMMTKITRAHYGGIF